MFQPSQLEAYQTFLLFMIGSVMEHCNSSNHNMQRVGKEVLFYFIYLTFI